MRRKRNNGTWFPVLGTHPANADAVNGVAFTLALVAAGNATTVGGVLPLTWDEPQEEGVTNIDQGLSHVIGNEYLCTRVVGKMLATLNANSTIPAALFTAGLFVARADDPTGAQGQDIPIGLSGNFNNYSPMAPDNMREPWMWRRTWILGSPVTGSGGFQNFPASTAEYGSMADGPHVDCKSKRRIGQDDRLWLAVAARRFPLTTSDDEGDSAVTGYFDYRILGTLRKARGKSAF